MGRMQTTVEAYPRRPFQEILQAVDCIYAAACGEMLWEQAVAKVCQVGEVDGVLRTLDPLEGRHVVLVSYGLGAAARPDTALGPAPRPSLTDSLSRSPAGTVFQDCLRTSGATTAPCWIDGVRARHWTSWACVIVHRDAREVVYLEVYTGVGRAPDSPEPGDFLRLLAPHLARAWRLGRTAHSTPARPEAARLRSDSGTHEASAPDLVAVSPVAKLRADFGLTKAEARLSLRLAEGSSLASAAEAFNVKLTTIRSQLQQVFAKTGTCRQAELVALLLSRGHGARKPYGTPHRPPQAEVSVAK